MRGEDQAEKMGLHVLYAIPVEVKSLRCKQGFLHTASHNKSSRATGITLTR